MPLHIPTSLVVMNLVGVQNGKVDTFFGALSNIKNIWRKGVASES